ncbi:hypothetical protein M422DRAFT_231798 [Sphaerobolus stellatus SS14]|uniref:Serine/threonine-protein phosphatase 4 regulatory subunit 3-like central domain-containing protein n=1 Tax=Sphaerobolus stellatus (strain SS14) TaxID=990650 RepID=A0A0C9URL2_SPHS4|nr:hypothetical protein M422DRAFT_231798 [Sphaerobolus stellatus SS14]
MVPSGSDSNDEGDLGSGESDGDWAQDDMDADMRRVKVYELVGQKWTDRGTAFCQGDYDEEAREAKLVARDELTNEILLQCTIRATDVYQRQQDTLIVWTEPDGTDFALSFQDAEGCAEVWEFIMEVQRHLQSKLDEEADSSEPGNSSMHMFTAGSMNPFVAAPKLPTPAIGNMQECERVIRALTRQPRLKENYLQICVLIQPQDYVKQVIDVMRQAEDLEDIKELHACCSCMQAILLINDISVYDYVVQDSLFIGVLGVLEYDPEFPTHKAQYRELLQSSAKFREPIPIRDPQVRSKIHMTYRLQLLKDFILARATDDATFNILNSNIAFNQIDICNSIHQDERFLREVVGLFLTADAKLDKDPFKQNEKGKEKEDPSKPPADEASKSNGESSGDVQSQSAPAARSEEYSPDERRKDTILLIQQLCLMGKNIQLPARMALFRSLVDRGILHTIQWALGRPEPNMLSAAGEILGIILDHDVVGVRQHVMRQVSMAGKPTPSVSHGMPDVMDVMEILGAQARKETLLEALCRSLINGHDQAFRSQMADALRTVLEVPQPDLPETNASVLRGMGRGKEDPVNERFIEYFYQKCAEALFRPLAELPECSKVTDRVLRLSRDRSNLYLYLCDLLSAFLLQHSFRSHFFVISTANTLPPLIPRIASLLRAKEKHVRLAALRFFRCCLKLGNRNIFSQLTKHEAILPILELTAREAPRDNLLSSCCQEFFEHIRRENFKDLIAQIMTRYERKVQELSQSPVCGERFMNLIRRWEINCEPPPAEVETAQP